MEWEVCDRRKERTDAGLEDGFESIVESLSLFRLGDLNPLR